MNPPEKVTDRLRVELVFTNTYYTDFLPTTEKKKPRNLSAKSTPFIS